LHQHQGRFPAARPALWNHHPHRASGHFSAPENQRSASRENGTSTVRLSCPHPHKYPAPAERLKRRESPRRAKSFETTPRAFAGIAKSIPGPGFRAIQIHLQRSPAQQFRTSFAFLWFIVHPAEQYVFEVIHSAGATENPSLRISIPDSIFVQRHQTRAQRIVDHSRKSPASAGSGSRQVPESAAHPASKPSSARSAMPTSPPEPARFTKLS